MCGICGVVTADRSKEVREEYISPMVSALYHRGPDDQGLFLGRRAALGVRRLSIIDLKGGHQPIHNEDKTLWIIFNGMIYNFLELRRQLQEKGHVFYTQADTEVIIHLYEEYGPDCVSYLNGMFAFAIWQVNEEALFLARDRLGVKPLYYINSGGYFLFASEIKAILQFPNINREIDLFALSQYLTFEYIPSPNSIFKEIKKLPPAHTLTHRDGNTLIKRYWNITINRDRKNNIDVEGATRVLSDLLEDAVRIRLNSDVPKGVFLSGGIDSSLVTAIACAQNGNRIKTFSIGFDEPSFDESKFFRRVTDYFGTEHYEKTFTCEELLDLLPAVSGLSDEPFADPSILPTYYLSKFAKEHITVALCGDGGDELFAGYPTYAAHKLAPYFELFPSALNRGLCRLAKSAIPVSMKNLSLDFQLKRFLEGLNNHPYIRHHLWMGAFRPQEKQGLFSPWAINLLGGRDIFADSRGYFEEPDTDGLLDKIQYLDIKTYLADDLLVKVDRASMANSLEVRSPFLDYRLFDFALNLPEKFRLNNLISKYILKKYAKGLIPKEIISRGKKGFGIPFSFWLRSKLKDFILDVFSEERIKREGFFQYPYIEKLLTDHFSNKCDNRKQIWTLLMFELWLEKYNKR